MIQLTLTNVNQLVDYTHINQYISISYNNENASNQYFGNFSESTRLDEADATIQVLNVESVTISQSEDDITNFIMNSSAPIRLANAERILILDGNAFSNTLAFREITDTMRFDIITMDTSTILVLYHKYVAKRNQDKETILNENNGENENA